VTLLLMTPTDPELEEPTEEQVAHELERRKRQQARIWASFATQGVISRRPR
jgi:hypothetical protein